MSWDVTIQIKQIEDIFYFFWGEYQIHFIECGEKNQYFLQVLSTSENVDIFTERDEIYLVFTPKKYIFSLLHSQQKIQKAQPNFSPGRFLLDLTFSVCLFGIT